MENALLSPIEAAQYLGVSRTTIYRLTLRGELQVYRPVPDAPRYRRNDLDAFIEGRRDDPRQVTPGNLARTVRHLKARTEQGEHTRANDQARP